MPAPPPESLPAIVSTMGPDMMLSRGHQKGRTAAEAQVLGVYVSATAASAFAIVRVLARTKPSGGLDGFISLARLEMRAELRSNETPGVSHR